MEITFLGTGPATGSSNASILVGTRETKVLIDCGPTVPSRLFRILRNPGELDAILITHRHGDHTL